MTYYIKEGFSSIFTHGLMSFASICIIIAFLVIMGSFVLLALNISAFVGELENENIILAYVDENLTDAQARALESRILAIPNVTEAEFVTREQAFEDFMGRQGDFIGYDDIDVMVFRHRFHVMVYDVALIGETQLALSEIRELPRINANLHIAQALVTARNIVRGISLVLIAVLLTISLFIMSNTIKLSTFERREEIAIMKMVGATNGFIRWPFVYEGFMLGISGALAAFAILWALYRSVANWVFNIEAGFLSVVPFSNVSLTLFVVFVAIGFGVGAGGSGIALNKYLRI